MIDGRRAFRCRSCHIASFLANQQLWRADNGLFCCILKLLKLTNLLFMQKVITTKYVALFALLALAFAVAVPAYANDDSKEYSEAEATEAIEEATEAVAEAVEAVEEETTDRGEYLETAEGYLTKAEAAFADEDYTAAYEWAEKAEDKSEYILDGEAAEEVDQEAAEEAIEDATEAIAEAQAAVDAEETDRGEYIEIAEEYLANAEAAFDDEDYEEAVEWAEKAEDKAEYILDEEDDEVDDKDEDKKDVWTEDKCESNPGIGHGVKKKCDADYAKSKNIKTDERYKDFGKSQDMDELRSQLEELMQLLIQLLTMQIAQQNN